MIHTCKICGTTSDRAEFYNGVNSRCKECHKEQARQNRAEKSEYYRQYDAKRYQEDPKVKARHERYRKTPEGKAAYARARKKWLSQNEEKRACHVILGNAVRDGRVLKPSACENCGAENCRIEGHHKDYAKPLDVIWLCKLCHVEQHKETRA